MRGFKGGPGKPCMVNAPGGEDGDPALENRVRPGHDNKRRGDDK